MNVPRAAPCVDNQALEHFDSMLRSGLSKMWIVSSATWHGFRLAYHTGWWSWCAKCCFVGPFRLLASVAATLDLQDAVLSEVEQETDSFVPRVAARWSEMFEAEPLSGSAARSQRLWDAAAINRGKTTLVVHNMNPIDRARLLAVSSPHAGDWLLALPVASCGLRLDNESIRVAVGLRLGCVLCSAHRCECGTFVSDQGVHGLSCRLAVGRLARHNAIQRHHTSGAWQSWAFHPSWNWGDWQARMSDDLTGWPWFRGLRAAVLPGMQRCPIHWPSRIWTGRCMLLGLLPSLPRMPRIANMQICRGLSLLYRLLSRHWAPFAPMVPNSSRSWGVGSRPSPAIRVIPRFCFNEFPSRSEGQCCSCIGPSEVGLRLRLFLLLSLYYFIFYLSYSLDIFPE